jgi:hypothetical protein
MAIRNIRLAPIKLKQRLISAILAGVRSVWKRKKKNSYVTQYCPRNVRCRRGKHKRCVFACLAENARVDNADTANGCSTRPSHSHGALTLPSGTRSPASSRPADADRARWPSRSRIIKFVSRFVCQVDRSSATPVIDRHHICAHLALHQCQGSLGSLRWYPYLPPGLRR